MGMSGKSYARVSVIPTTAGPTALIGDPGPTYTPRTEQIAPGLELGLQAHFMEWPFPETERAKARRYLALALKLARSPVWISLAEAMRDLGLAAEQAKASMETLREAV